MSANEPIVVREVAEEEFLRFCETTDISTDVALMDEDDEKSFLAQQRRVVNSIMRGNCVINDEGLPEYTPIHPKSGIKDTIVFRERSGNTLLAMDNLSKQHRKGEVAKMYALLGDLTGLIPKQFASLVGTDIKTCEAIGNLLMG